MMSNKFFPTVYQFTFTYQKMYWHINYISLQKCMVQIQPIVKEHQNDSLSLSLCSKNGTIYRYTHASLYYKET